MRKAPMMGAVGVGMAAVWRRLRSDPAEPDPAHAPGHHHLGPPPEQAGERKAVARPGRNQPWIRTTHSDSQKRRFRR